MPFETIKYLPSLLPCVVRMGANRPWSATLLRKEDSTLWAITKDTEAPIPFCQFLGKYHKTEAALWPMETFDAMLEYVTIPPLKVSLATVLRTFTVLQIQRLPLPPVVVAETTTGANTTAFELVLKPNSNAILSIASTQAILERLKAKNAELQAHFDLLTEAATLKERNQFIEASIRQLAAKLDA